MASSLGVWHDCWGYVAALSFLAVLSTLTVALRFWSRRISGSGAHLDDWLALAALLFHHGLCGTVLAAFLANGLGFGTSTLAAADSRAVIELQKIDFVENLLYGTGWISVRLSIVLFYLHVFTTGIVRRGTYGIAVVSVCWFITVEILTLTTCIPIAFRWDPNIHGHCITARAADVVPAVVDLAINVATLGLPVHELFKLKLERDVRFLIFGSFLIGGITIAASTARLVAILLNHTSDGSADGSAAALRAATTGFEIYIAIIAACAPTLLPLYKRLTGRRSESDTLILHTSNYTTRPSRGLSQTRNRTGPKSAGSKSVLRESDEESQPFKKLNDVEVLVPPKERGGFWTDISARPASKGIPHGGGIRVQRDVTWKNSQC